jgi:PKD repeat protein
MRNRKVWLSLSILFLVFVLLLSLFMARPAIPAAGAAEIDPHLLAAMAASPDGTADFLVVFRERADLSPAYALSDWDERGRFVVEALQAVAGRTQTRVRAWLDAQGIAYRAFFSENSLYLTADLAVLNRLAAFPEVAALRANAVHVVDEFPSTEIVLPAATVPWNIAQVGADQVWQDFGVKGQGIVVATLDTGAEYTHDALFPNYKCGAGPHDDCWYDPTNTYPTAPGDGAGRGTHLMGVLVGDDDPSLTYSAGMAPDAQWIACKGCTDGGVCTDANLNACADWLLAPNGNPANRPHVIGFFLNSLQKCDGWFLTQIMSWQAAGIYTSARGGSNGPACDTMRAPGSYEGILASGPTDENDLILSSSSRGPGCNGGIKPDVAAPGANICSAYPGNTWYCGYSGSSFSTAHSAGLAALLYSADPGLIGHAISTTYAITSTALCIEDLSCGGTPCPDGANNVYGWGRIDAYAAVEAVLQPCEPITGADFSWEPTTPTAGEIVTLTGIASGTEPIGYSWTLGDGNWKEGAVVTHTYDMPGIYTVVLTATNCATATATVTHTITVESQPCEPVHDLDFSWMPLAPAIGQVVTFTGWASGTEPITYSWMLEAGNWKEGEVVTNTYDTPGVYTVILTATNCETATATTTHTITVVSAPPCEPVREVDFSWQPFTPTAGLPFTLTAWVPSGWFTTTVDSVGDVGMAVSLALDPAGRPHISYRDETNTSLRYAHDDGTGWQTTMVDNTGDVGTFTSIAVDAQGHPHISYYDEGSYDLKYAHYDGTTWQIATVDSTGNVGRCSSLALDTLGQPHISYFDESNGAIRYAYYDGTWHTQTVDPAVGGVCPTALGLDAAGRPHVAYMVNTYELRYAYLDGTWQYETISANGEAPDLAIDAAGRPHVSYFGSADVLYAYRDGSGWHSEILETVGWPSADSSLALEADGTPHVSYYQRTDGVLRYATRAGGAWDILTVDAAGSTGPYNALALDAAGQPRIAYDEWDAADLRYAWWVAAPAEPIAYSWRLDVGSWQEGQVVTYTYDLPGTYVVMLTATNCATATATAVHTVTVACPPVTGLELSWAPFTPTAGQLVTLTAVASSTLPITYAWDLGDGAGAAGPLVTHTYAAGTYTVALTATNGCDLEWTTAALTAMPVSWRVYLPLVFK